MWRKGLAIGITAVLALAQEAPIRREGAHWVQVVTGSIAIPPDCSLKVETRGPVTLRGIQGGASQLHNQEESSRPVRGGSSRSVECRRGADNGAQWIGQYHPRTTDASPGHRRNGIGQPARPQVSVGGDGRRGCSGIRHSRHGSS